MKKNKGFTLVELLAVIVILGILISISTVAVNSIRKKQEAENEKNVISSILSGAKAYVGDNEEVLNSIPASISVGTLKNGNYTDFDTNKFGSYLSKNVTINACGDAAGVKLKYSFAGYNDCGCEQQGLDTNGTTSETLCTD